VIVAILIKRLSNQILTNEQKIKGKALVIGYGLGDIVKALQEEVDLFKNYLTEFKLEIHNETSPLSNSQFKIIYEN
jgi:hypothetical protein